MVKTKKNTKVSAFECEKCGDIIYSRDTHDFHYCTCGDIAIDGGFDYVKVSYKTKMPKLVFKHISATKKELFNDWNNRINKFGVIHKKKES